MKKRARQNAVKALVLTAITVMVITGCGGGKSGGGGGGGKGGILTITDIPSKFNGQYAIFHELLAGNDSLFAYQSADAAANTVNYCRIENGKLTMPMWVLNRINNKNERYYGDGTVGSVRFTITDAANSNERTTDNMTGVWDYSEILTFKNGSMKLSWNQGIASFFK
jgi:hypothetical protein